VFIDVYGTTQDSQVTISTPGSHPWAVNSHLAIAGMKVHSGRVGSILGLTTADLLGRLSPLQGPVAALQFDAIGPAARIDIAGNLGQLLVNQNVNLGPGGHVDVSNDLTGPLSVTGNVTLNGGQIVIGRDLLGPVTVGGDLQVLNSGLFLVGRDLGAASGVGAGITGNLILSSDGKFSVGRQLYSLAVGGRIDTSMGGDVQAGGDLKNLTVNGFIQGKRSNDIVVGLDLSQLTVLGIGNSGGSIDSVNIAVGKNIQGLDVRYGIFNSLVTAGILIDGGTAAAGSNGWSIGPVGPVAVFDSEIRAGNSIRNLTIGGDVQSDQPVNPAGQPTRIVAGEDAQGIFTAAGVIDNFVIVGNLIDSVLAASVRPFQGTYPQPAPGPNSTAPPFADPTVPLSIVLAGGTINPSFASSSGGSPTKLTVMGAVITGNHVYTADYAGIFAATTKGVQVGTPST
jgi:hypothetical protein